MHLNLVQAGAGSRKQPASCVTCMVNCRRYIYSHSTQVTARIHNKLSYVHLREFKYKCKFKLT